jgi:catechol 2,3-dioxygenase-like lactoylglutathione lyase family enzyme
MIIIPVFKCRNMKESLSFYTRILGFVVNDPSTAPMSTVVTLTLDDVQIQLSVLDGDGVFGSAVNILVDDVDELFRTLVHRGLNTSGREASPVHQAPVDQTWGTRELYVDDPDGNTVRFQQLITK